MRWWLVVRMCRKRESPRKGYDDGGVVMWCDAGLYLRGYGSQEVDWKIISDHSVRPFRATSADAYIYFVCADVGSK